MNEIQHLAQQFVAALWEAGASSLTDTPADQTALALEIAAEVEAQIAGFRLHTLHEARLAGAEKVLDQERHSLRTTTKQATATLKLASELGDRFPLIAAALNEGRISVEQTRAIIDGLRKLPSQLTRSELAQCQETILEHAHSFGPQDLRKLAARLYEVVDPDGADEEEAKRLAAQDRAAERNRSVRFSFDGHGTGIMRAVLPEAQMALLKAQIDALMPSISSYRETNQLPAPDARRADALVLWAGIAANSKDLPAHGGDRPHVYVGINLDTLLTGLGGIDLIGIPEIDSISPGEARRLACDAGIIPAVLGSHSEPLDVGREHRLFTPTIRAALTLRDQGCAFPGCEAPPVACDGHHIVPWWAGGPTSTGNAVLLCPHHHRLLEPDPQLSPHSQWKVHLDPVTGLPVFTPPRHIDPMQRPRQHQRFLLRQLRHRPKAPPCPDEPAPPEPPWTQTGPKREVEMSPAWM
ncbi:MAG: DUF222 domain-containing protein [Propionibacteriaceae bacterium]|nr:DUF222 domain-containing protein [Propionibacteriaceae bacterium]